ncbi:MAG: hypothetical protein A2V96_01960 [Candidatus Yonathbacteria bacterium RBG_16_43_6]|uniref:Uncharacterized protein n=1 Tax=Candidatus Yonathbacteria bacterium RIFCSPLOWO2_01_FULL_43_27 TaxID=1802726 RepID=A0A1G2SDS3_9BACT|nr:MAG: hypothetical protein A2658_02595 [Candidatus Yonathbacteria bacterium RIFCSPHIGHO2_01_FULL_44_19]OHA80110.1 MAG: hypothetical protein A2V96_01960 [Candidatus Yonathbacteria bacterium RBG_16_43_6]OHA83150.1 MAG: hypothetical protein A3B07_00045 [Candidatus Yonathbacteria bacterium RIFCSPLOWO2_01_FULL_43_27]
MEESFIERNFSNGSIGPYRDAGKVVVSLVDEFAAKVSCNIFKYLSIKEFHTHFIERRNTTSFNAFHCKPLGFNVVVNAGNDGVHTVDFFLNDRMHPLICTGEQAWRLLCDGEEIDEIEPLLSVEDEVRVRNMASNAFKALRCALRKKAEAELYELKLEFGRRTQGYMAGKPIITGIVTSRECRVASVGGKKNIENSDFNLATLTEKLFS